MKIVDVIRIIDARVVCGKVTAEDAVASAFGADLMSDVLAFVKTDTLILTGMVNTHVIRTAEMLDVKFIVFVRGKEPNAEMIEMADELGLVLMTTENTLFTSCGLLYMNGLESCTREEA